jgi:two-component system alkaline phosphatase synthesis response regulator PhoP
MSGTKILIVEDEPDILEVMAHNLGREGYEVLMARDGAEGLRLAREQSPDLLVLDLMLPGMDGLEVCRILKEERETRALPIIMVSAKDAESDVILGLGLGADDYVPKPFSPRELVARVRAVLRRGRLQDKAAEGEKISRGGLVIDMSRHRVEVKGSPVEFTATELRLLHYLAAHPGRVFTRDQLLDRVMGEKISVINRNIDVHVRAIRSKLGPNRDRLETVRGVGYRFSDSDA